MLLGSLRKKSALMNFFSAKKSLILQNAAQVEKNSKNYVRNALKCAQISKISAQKPYIIMR